MGKLFEVDIEGLDEFRARFSQKQMGDRVAAGLVDVSNRLVTSINDSVKKTYTVKQSPNTVLTKDVVNLIGATDNKQHIDLIYAFEAIPLHKFDVKAKEVSVRSRFKMLRGNNGKYAIRKRTNAYQALAKVRRSGGYKPVTGKRGYGGFFRKSGNSTKWRMLQAGLSGSNYRGGVFERKFSDTWNDEPVDRSGRLRLLFGPSLSQMVATQMNESPLVGRVLDDIPNVMMGHMNL